MEAKSEHGETITSVVQVTLSWLRKSLALEAKSEQGEHEEIELQSIYVLASAAECSGVTIGQCRNGNV
jgi:hypothetical protein